MQLFIRFAAVCASAVLSHPALATQCIPEREAVSLTLPDFVSPAELVVPPAGTPRRGVLVLFPGSDVADMDGAIEGVKGVIVSRPMRQVADRLACAGFVSLRYNKRFVTGPTTVDRAQFGALNGADLASDGRVALAFALKRPELANLPVGLVGWSEGTTVAMAVASSEPSVRAIVLIAPVVDPPARTAQAQYARIGKPYLQRFATNDALDAEAIARATNGPGGVLAQIFVRMFRGFRSEERINSLLDKNSDGRISFSEADPIIAGWYDDGPESGLGMSSTARALKGVSEAFSPSTPRLLILQGFNDSMIAPAASKAFAARPDTRRSVKLITYAGLGHSLGKARSAQEDQLLPTADKPLDDMTSWLQRALKRN